MKDVGVVIEDLSISLNFPSPHPLLSTIFFFPPSSSFPPTSSVI